MGFPAGEATQGELFSNNNYFSNNQFGFIIGRSTTLQLLCIMDEWTTLLDSGAQVDVIYTDFEKAFDTVPHGRLLTKLKPYNISDKIIAWIQDFLCNSVRVYVYSSLCHLNLHARNPIPVPFAHR